LAEGTLAFYLADQEAKADIQALFVLLAENIGMSIKSSEKVRFFKRTLYGLQDAKYIGEWIEENLGHISVDQSSDELLRVFWPLIIKISKNSTAAKLNSPDALLDLAALWMQGLPYHELLTFLIERDVKLIWGTQFRNLKIEHIVNICDGGFAYDGALLLGAIAEYIEQLDFETKDEVVERLHLLLKMFKYGLPNQGSISLYELGLPDRVIVQDLVEALNLTIEQKPEVKLALTQRLDLVQELISKYPSYFVGKLNELV
jgi:POLQ-like helicase